MPALKTLGAPEGPLDLRAPLPLRARLTYGRPRLKHPQLFIEPWRASARRRRRDGRTIEVARVRIAEAGRRALADRAK
jgi:hypothetical protein